MHNQGPIPTLLVLEFVGFMDAHNDAKLPDGAWQAKLEDAAHDVG